MSWEAIEHAGQPPASLAGSAVPIVRSDANSQRPNGGLRDGGD
jgi:hypothetical protein